MSPCFNDLFIGSKGMFGIPLAVALRVRREMQPVERMTVELSETDPNYKVETLGKITAQLDKEYFLKYSVNSAGGRTVINIANYGK